MNPTITIAPKSDVTPDQKSGALATLGIGVFGTGFLLGFGSMFLLAGLLSKK